MTKAKAQNEGSDITPAKHPGGRPSIYSAELAERICERLAEGEPLVKICGDPEMPSFGTVYRWERDNEEFRQLSAQAREIGTHYMAGDCIVIADGEGDPADKRVRIDTRLRLIGKWNAKNYGDKHIHVGGGPDDAPIRHEVDLTGLSDEELEQLERIRSKIGAALTGGDQGGEGSAQA